MMKWEAEQKGYTCNDCFLSMQNCHDMSICCEDETGLCDYFEERRRMNDLIGRQAAIDAFDGVVKVRSLKNAETVMDYIREVVKRIHDLPPAWAGQTWIPCHKRLPGDGEEVFVYLYDSPYIAWVKDGHWYTEEFEVEKENEPMAWMPLPTLYKEDKGDS